MTPAVIRHLADSTERIAPALWPCDVVLTVVHGRLLNIVNLPNLEPAWNASRFKAIKYYGVRMMTRAALTAAALVMAVSPAFAATNSSTANAVDIHQQITQNLQRSGFTDVKVMPDSFLVQAKDKNGNPMTMFLTPNSMEIAEVGTVGTPGQHTQADRAAGGVFTTVPSQDDLSSKLVGLSVYNNANQDIGDIKDIAFSNNGVKAYILAVGGFIGMGDHYVAVRPSALDISYNASQNKWQAKMEVNAGQLKAAPEYKYQNNS
jgi:PRC-barrel domain